MSEPEIRRALNGRVDAVAANAASSPLAAEFAALFRAQPAAIAQMLAQHVDDGTGHCRVCTSGGRVGRSTWPCRLYELADQASQLTSGGQP
jgi:hypothetical protein